MPSTLRIQADRITADLVAQHLRQEGIPAQVVADSDLMAVAGTPMAFSVVVPTQWKQRARAIIAEAQRKPRRKLPGRGVTD